MDIEVDAEIESRLKVEEETLTLMKQAILKMKNEIISVKAEREENQEKLLEMLECAAQNLREWRIN